MIQQLQIVLLLPMLLLCFHTVATAVVSAHLFVAFGVATAVIEAVVAVIKIY